MPGLARKINKSREEGINQNTRSHRADAADFVAEPTKHHAAARSAD